MSSPSEQSSPEELCHDYMPSDLDYSVIAAGIFPAVGTVFKAVGPFKDYCVVLNCVHGSLPAHNMERIHLSKNPPPPNPPPLPKGTVPTRDDLKAVMDYVRYQEALSKRAKAGQTDDPQPVKVLPHYQYSNRGGSSNKSIQCTKCEGKCVISSKVYVVLADGYKQCTCQLPPLPTFEEISHGRMEVNTGTALCVLPFNTAYKVVSFVIRVTGLSVVGANFGKPPKYLDLYPSFFTGNDSTQNITALYMRLVTGAYLPILFHKVLDNNLSRGSSNRLRLGGFHPLPHHFSRITNKITALGNTVSFQPTPNVVFVGHTSWTCMTCGDNTTVNTVQLECRKSNCRFVICRDCFIIFCYTRPVDEKDDNIYCLEAFPKSHIPCPTCRQPSYHYLSQGKWYKLPRPWVWLALRPINSQDEYNECKAAFEKYCLPVFSKRSDLRLTILELEAQQNMKLKAISNLQESNGSPASIQALESEIESIRPKVMSIKKHIFSNHFLPKWAADTEGRETKVPLILECAVDKHEVAMASHQDATAKLEKLTNECKVSDQLFANARLVAASNVSELASKASEALRLVSAEHEKLAHSRALLFCASSELEYARSSATELDALLERLNRIDEYGNFVAPILPIAVAPNVPIAVQVAIAAEVPPPNVAEVAPNDDSDTSVEIVSVMTRAQAEASMSRRRAVTRPGRHAWRRQEHKTHSGSEYSEYDPNEELS